MLSHGPFSLPSPSPAPQPNVNKREACVFSRAKPCGIAYSHTTPTRSNENDTTEFATSRPTSPAQKEENHAKKRTNNAHRICAEPTTAALLALSLYPRDAFRSLRETFLDRAKQCWTC